MSFRQQLSRFWKGIFQRAATLKVDHYFLEAAMARLQEGARESKLGKLWRLLRSHGFGLRESEAASELGWNRRITNNYLRELQRLNRAYKDGCTWQAED
jgi:hypothetical protein